MPVERKTEAVTKAETKVVAVVCNRCKKRLEVGDSSNLDAHVFKVSGFYGSSYPEDTTTIEFVLCSGCLEAVCSAFEIGPTVTGWMGSGDYPHWVVLQKSDREVVGCCVGPQNVEDPEEAMRQRLDPSSWSTHVLERLDEGGNCPSCEEGWDDPPPPEHTVPTELTVGPDYVDALKSELEG